MISRLINARLSYKENKMCGESFQTPYPSPSLSPVKPRLFGWNHLILPRHHERWTLLENNIPLDSTRLNLKSIYICSILLNLLFNATRTLSISELLVPGKLDFSFRKTKLLYIFLKILQIHFWYPSDKLNVFKSYIQLLNLRS